MEMCYLTPVLWPSLSPPRRPYLMREYSGLLTDLYELTMAAGYVQTGFDGVATFELFVRNLPPHRNFLVAAGLEQALEYLGNVNFSAGTRSLYLRASSDLLGISVRPSSTILRSFAFQAMCGPCPKGPWFPGEPLHASGGAHRPGADNGDVSARDSELPDDDCEQSCARRHGGKGKGRDVVDFSARRGHGGPASLLAARAAVIGGCAGTSNVLAGQQFGLNTYGTQAHSWVMAHEDEAEAFGHFLDTFPEGSVLLVDTYDVRNAVKKIVAMGRKPAGVRLDSGDLVKDSRWARREIDRAGWQDVKIFASGDLDEYKIEQFLAAGAAIDAFGVGTALGTPGDAPHLNLIYKLVEVERDGKVHEAAKFSHAKVTYPGRKQVFRRSNTAGEFKNDKIALEGEPANGGSTFTRPGDA